MTVFIIAAMTVDGFIGRQADTRSFDWTSSEDKKFYVDSIKRAGVVIMGMKTFQTFTRYPRGLRYIIYTSKPEDFVNPAPTVIEATATKKSPREIIQELEVSGQQEVAICGGASIYTMFLQAGVVDRLYLTVEPIVFGQGVSLLNQEVDVQLQLISEQKLSAETLLLEYAVQK